MRTAEEILKEKFPNADQLDWFKPIVLAMNEYHVEGSAEEIKKQIVSDVYKVHPFVWPKNKNGEDVTQLVGQTQPPGSKKHKLKNEKYIQWAEHGYSLAQPEIDRLKLLIKTQKCNQYYNDAVNRGSTNEQCKQYVEEAWKQFKQTHKL